MIVTSYSVQAVCLLSNQVIQQEVDISLLMTGNG